MKDGSIGKSGIIYVPLRGSNAAAMERLAAWLDQLREAHPDVTFASASALLGDLGLDEIPFGYPVERDVDSMEAAYDELARALQVPSTDPFEAVGETLLEIRRGISDLIGLNFRAGRVSGRTVWDLLVRSGDFGGYPRAFKERLDLALEKGAEKQPLARRVRLGLIGDPCPTPELFGLLEALGAEVFFQEAIESWAMPGSSSASLSWRTLECPHLWEAGRRSVRIHDEVLARSLYALIHIVWSGAYRKIEEISIKEEVHVPILTLEFSYPAVLTPAHTMRIESFVASFLSS